MSVRIALALAAALPFTAVAQAKDPLTWTGKAKYHAESTCSPIGDGGLCGLCGRIADPRYANRVGDGAVLGTASVSLPRSHGRVSTAPWRLAWIAHCARIPAITVQAPEGCGASDTLCAGRYSRVPTRAVRRCHHGGWEARMAFLSNEWYPDRLNTVRLGLLQGSMTLGFDLAVNLGAEFWPDVKRKVLRRQ